MTGVLIINTAVNIIQVKDTTFLLCLVDLLPSVTFPPKLMALP